MVDVRPIQTECVQNVNKDISCTVTYVSPILKDVFNIVVKTAQNVKQTMFSKTVNVLIGKEQVWLFWVEMINMTSI